MKSDSSVWVRISLLNLAIVAVLGTVMRYKIGFALPYLEQKFLQEAHSHFAFSGWITHTLYFLLVNVFRTALPGINEKIYTRLLLLNLLAAYGMVICFSLQGYGPVSLVFSTLSVMTGYVFSWFALKDAGRLPADHPGKNWIKVALWFGILSTFGTMVLSWMMATRQYDQNTYLGSVYFYLHFQYNGWFLFACIGIFMDRIKHFTLDPKLVRRSFLLFALAGIPAYFLSTLWANIPGWLYIIVVLAAIAQVVGWWFFIRLIRNHLESLSITFSKIVRLLLLVVALALTVKLFLQLGSTIPEVSKLAFGFRPIVIAYLHLVLLLIISVFLLTFMFGTGQIRSNMASKIAILAFTTGVILNEMALAVQGIWAFSYTVIPLANEFLFGVASVMMLSALILFISQLKTTKLT